MGGCASRERSDTEAVGGGGAAAESAQHGGGGPNGGAANDNFRRGLSTADEENFHIVAISALQSTFNVIDGTAAPLSGQAVQHTDYEAYNSPPDLEANNPVPPLAVHVGCLPRSFNFIVKHTKCVAIISSIVGNCCKVIIAHCTPTDGQQGEDLQERCYEYSLRALGFETLTFIASCIVVPVVASSTGSITILIVAAAGLLVAILIEFFSLTKKTKLGRLLVYLSSSLVMLTTFLIFISFDKRYAYGILAVPALIIGAALLQHKILPGVHDDNEEAIQEKLDNIFKLWSIILNFGAFITLIFTYNMEAKYSSASATGFLFMLTIVLALFEMMVAAARPVALAHLATYLHYLLIILFVSTLTSTLVAAIVKSLESSG